MKISLLIATLVLAPYAFAQSEGGAQAGAQGNAATQTGASASAGPGDVSASNTSAGSASATPEGASANLASGTEVHATLDKPIDAGKNKPGDRVVATATQDVKSDGRVVVRKGSRLIGHVTEAKPRGKGEAEGRSELGIVFDHAILRDGTKVPLNATVQAVAAANAAASGGLRDAESQRPTMSGSPGRTQGGLGGTVSGAVDAVADASGSVRAGENVGRNVVTRSAGAVGGLNATGRLHSGSRGVFGMKDLDITSTASGTAGGNIVTSDERDVRLNGGTQMLLTTSTSAGKQTADATNRSPEARRDAAEAQRDTR
jgi:hypothetical protein